MVLALCGWGYQYHQRSQEAPILQLVQPALEAMASAGLPRYSVPSRLFLPNSQAEDWINWLIVESPQAEGDEKKAETKVANPIVTMAQDKAEVRANFTWIRTFSGAPPERQGGTATLWLLRTVLGWRIYAITISMHPNPGTPFDVWRFAPVPPPPQGIENAATMAHSPLRTSFVDQGL